MNEVCYTVVRVMHGYFPHCISSHSDYLEADRARDNYTQMLVDKGINVDQFKFEIQINAWNPL